jgi:flagellar biosynthesis regulator FlaF
MLPRLQWKKEGEEMSDSFDTASEDLKYHRELWAKIDALCKQLEECHEASHTYENTLILTRSQLGVAIEAMEKARVAVAEKHHKEDAIYFKPNLVAYEILDDALAEINRIGKENGTNLTIDNKDGKDNDDNLTIANPSAK